MTMKFEFQKEQFVHLEGHLASQVHGSYLVNRALIRLSMEASFWLRTNEPTIERLSIFIHEYAHYLHNFSTIAGIYEFIADLRRARLFINTVDQHGRSHGHAALGDAEKREYASAVAWRDHLSGNTIAPYSESYHVRDVKFSLESVKRIEFPVLLGPQSFTFVQVLLNVAVSSASAPTESVQVRLGSHVLMEGLAWEIEHMLYQSVGLDSHPMEGRIPAFPYTFCRQVFESVSCIKPSREILAKALLLALQSSDPGSSFVAICEAFKNIETPAKQAKKIAQLTETTLLVFEVVAPRLVDGILQSEASAFAKRGHAGRGIASLVDLCRQYILVRLENPFFELDIISSGLDRDALEAMLAKYPPCPILQSTGPDSCDIEFYLLGGSALEEKTQAELGAAQSLL